MKKLLVIALLGLSISLFGCTNEENTEITNLKEVIIDMETSIADYKIDLSGSKHDMKLMVEKNNYLVLQLREEDDILVWASTGEVVEEKVEEPVVIVKNVELNKEWFASQPDYAVGNYEGNTEQLNNFAHSNMRRIFVPENATNMIIKLAKNATPGRNIIVFVKAPKRYCGWRILWSDLWLVEWHIFSFDITNMDIQGIGCDGNRAKKLWGETISIWGYISEYNGNKIEDIIFN